jgi:hypothetical protein
MEALSSFEALLRTYESKQRYTTIITTQNLRKSSEQHKMWNWLTFQADTKSKSAEENMNKHTRGSNKMCMGYKHTAKSVRDEKVDLGSNIYFPN